MCCVWPLPPQTTGSSFSSAFSLFTQSPGWAEKQLHVPNKGKRHKAKGSWSTAAGPTGRLTYSHGRFLTLSSNPCSLASVPTTRWHCSCWNHQRPRLPAPWVLFSPSGTWPFNGAEQCWPHLLLEISTAIGFWSNTLDFPLSPRPLLSLLCHLFIPYLTSSGNHSYGSQSTLSLRGSHSFPRL